MDSIVLRDRNGKEINYHGIDYLNVKTPDGETQGYAAYDPETLVPENLVSGVVVGDVEGNLSVPQAVETTIAPDFSAGDMEVVPEDGQVFSKVSIPTPSNLVPANIAKGVEIAGVVGTLDGGGADIGKGDYLVTVIDYDGTVLLEKLAFDGEVIQLPDPPEHERLAFDQWSASVEVLNDTVTVNGCGIVVGAVYYTKSDATEVDIKLSKVTGLTFTFNSVLTNKTSIDWGDGTVDNTLTHTYATHGEYTIKIYGMTAIATGTTSGGIAAADFSKAVQAVFLRYGTTELNNYAFYACYEMARVSLPSTIKTIGTSVFHACRDIAGIVFPPSVTSIGSYAVAYSLAHIVVIPHSCTTIKDHAFYNANGLSRVVLPNNVTLQSDVFYNCYAVSKVEAQGHIKSIATYVFSGLYGCRVYNFARCTSVPTLSNTNAFLYITPNCEIRVPAALYNSWKSATNWSTYADYIVAA